MARAEFYSASVAVEDRQQASYEQGLRQALVRVLSKVSGAPPEVVNSRPSLAQDLAQGQRLASQFVYYNERVLDAEGNEQSQLRIRASFPESDVINLLQKGGLSFWAEQRPSILFLPMLHAAGFTRRLDDDYLYRQQIQQVLDKTVLNWGLNVSVEPVSGQDLNALWRHQPEQLQQLAAQTSHSVLLLANFRTIEQQQLSGDVLLLDGDRSYTAEFEGESLPAWLEEMMQWALQQLAAEYAVQLLAGGNEVLLVVDGVSDYQAYENVLAYLGELDIVENTYVLAVDGERLRIAVTLKTEIKRLQDQLREDGKLQASDISDRLYRLNLIWQP